MIIDKLKFRSASASDREVLSKLWQEAFSDGDEFFSLFFDNGFSPANSLCATIDGEVIAALYWFDFIYRGKPIAYIYGVAVFEKHRGEGVGTALLNEAEKIIKMRGYSGVLLLPAKPPLYSYYERFGYKIATKISKFTVNASGKSVPLEIILPDLYEEVGEQFQKDARVKAGNFAKKFLGAQYILARGEKFLLSGYKQGNKLIASEFLGDMTCAPDVLSALGCEFGEFRTEGDGERFAMYHAFTDDLAPAYFATVFD